MLNGWQPIWRPGEYRADFVQHSSGVRAWVPQVAQEILGATDEERSCLFYLCGTLEDIKQTRDQIVAGDPAELADYGN